MARSEKADVNGRVVIVDDEMAAPKEGPKSAPWRLRQTLEKVISSAGYQAIWVGSEAEAFKALLDARTVFCFLDMDLKAGGSGANVFDFMVTEAKKRSQWIPLLTLTKFSRALSDENSELREGQEGRENFPPKVELVKRYRSRLYDWVEKYDILTGKCSEEFLINTIVSWVRNPRNEDKKLVLAPGTGAEPTTVDIVECGRGGKSGRSILTRAYSIPATADWRSIVGWPKGEDRASFEAVMVRLLCAIATSGEPVSVTALFGNDNVPQKFTRSTSAFNQAMRSLARGNLTPDLLCSVGGKMWELKVPHIEVVGDASAEKRQARTVEDPGAPEIAALHLKLQRHMESYEEIVIDFRKRITVLEAHARLSVDASGAPANTPLKPSSSMKKSRKRT